MNGWEALVFIIGMICITSIFIAPLLAFLFI